MASSIADGLPVPLIMESCTFDMRQEEQLKEMEKRMFEEVKKKKREWEKEVDKMKVEFLSLYPSDKEWGSNDSISDPLVINRKGSTDVLDPKKMKTMFLEYPDSGCRFKVRFDVGQYERKTVTVSTDDEKICVRAVKIEEDDECKTIEREYIRKIEKPREVDSSKLKSFLTQDGILVVEAPMPPHSLNLTHKKFSNSPSHSSHGSYQSQNSHPLSRSRSPSSSPHTPHGMPKTGIPQFIGDDGEKMFRLLIEIGTAFKPKDVTILVLKDNRIQIKAKNEMHTSDRLSKNKYFKEYELPDRIETMSVRGGITETGKVIVCALGKGHPKYDKNNFQDAETVETHIHSKLRCRPINILDVSSFPPTHVKLAKKNNFDFDEDEAQ